MPFVHMPTAELAILATDRTADRPPYVSTSMNPFDKVANEIRRVTEHFSNCGSALDSNADMMSKMIQDIVREARLDYDRRSMCTLLDRAEAFGKLERIMILPLDWNGYGAIPIDRNIGAAAERFIEMLPANVVTTPAVVPMTLGRLQFEWHRGNRSLEIEFESPASIHYLKCDDDLDISEEEIIPANSTAELHALLRWFAS